jgi:hypothetical protein
MQILELGRHQIATELKDAVFALYGMLQRINPDIVSPDYSKSVEQIHRGYKNGYSTRQVSTGTSNDRRRKHLDQFALMGSRM